jgi:hypothetical protein
MFKALILQTSHNLSDERTEYLIKDRLSFMRFDDECADFMIADGRSGAMLAEDPPGKGELVRCPCCHHGWRRK